MPTYALPSLSIPLEDGFDVLVAGAGAETVTVDVSALRAALRAHGAYLP